MVSASLLRRSRWWSLCVGGNNKTRRFMVVDMSDWRPEPEDIRQHLSMMQSVIARMAYNRRVCKTWAVTLVAAILVVVTKFEIVTATSGSAPLETWIAVIPATVFLTLDFYYLLKERALIVAYNGFVSRLHAGKLKADDLFVIAPSSSKAKRLICTRHWITICLFYLTLIGLIAVIYILQRSQAEKILPG